MKRILVFTITIFFALFSIGQTQHDLNEEAKKEYENADKELNETYNKILKEYKEDTAFIQNLKKSQRLWLQFRDAEMKVKFPGREVGYYGSVQPMCWSMYKEELTRERLKTLKVWLEGVEEGDVCNGSVRIKQ